MPFRLKISNEEVKSELVKMGYSDLSDDTINEFRRDLLKLIKEDLKNIKKLKQSQQPDKFKDYGSFSTSTSNSEYLKEKMMSPTSSGFSETLQTNSESQECLPVKNSKFKWKGEETASSSSSSSPSLSQESAKPTIVSEPSVTKDLRISVTTQKTEKTIPSVKLKDSKDKGLPTYPDKPDAVNLYHYYKAHWDKYKVPGEDPRSALRWEIRSQLFYSS